MEKQKKTKTEDNDNVENHKQRKQIGSINTIGRDVTSTQIK